MRRRVGKGTAINLAFWPKGDSLLRLFRSFIPTGANPLAAPVPAGMQAVPRSDGSLFVMNTSPRPGDLRLSGTAVDRISGRTLSGTVPVKAYEVFWLE